MYGRFCNECSDKKSFFLRKEKRPSTCAQCFCNGLRVNCEPSSLYYSKISSSFERDAQEWTVNNVHRNLSTLVYKRQDFSIEFSQFDDFLDQDLFFYAPRIFLGNKVLKVS